MYIILLTIIDSTKDSNNLNISLHIAYSLLISKTNFIENKLDPNKV